MGGVKSAGILLCLLLLLGTTPGCREAVGVDTAAVQTLEIPAAPAGPHSWWVSYRYPLVVVATLVLVFLALRSVIRRVTSPVQLHGLSPHELATLDRARTMVWAGYTSVAFFLALTILPFILVERSSPLARFFAKTPIAFVEGCDASLESEESDFVCKGPGSQTHWVVSLFGSIERLSAVDFETLNAGIATIERLSRDGAANVRNRTDAANETRLAAILKEAKDLRKAASQIRGDSETREASPDTRPRYRVTKGIVVPAFFVWLATAGAIVSLARRLTEIQQRTHPRYKPPEIETSPSGAQVYPPGTAPLTLIAAREQIAFQIFQVVTAPLIALAIYRLVTPDDVAMAVVLAFGSGFASEPILLRLRQAAVAIAGAALTRFSKPEDDESPRGPNADSPIVEEEARAPGNPVG